MSEGEAGGSAGGSDQRNFYRVRARLPIRARAIDAGEAETLSFELTSPSEEAVPKADPGLLAILQRIENKLDVILAQLDERRPRPLTASDLEIVELSGGGVAFETDADELGDQVLVELQIPGPPPRTIRAIAHPVPTAEPEEPRGDAKRALSAFAFDVISERDRDAIVHFSQDVQRRELRQRAGARSAR